MYESVALFIAAFMGVVSVPLIASSAAAGDEQPLQQVINRTMPSQRERAALAPFMTLPLQKKDVPREALTVNEGWYYSPEEMRIHGKALHRGIDWPVKRGTPVVAVADGYAVRSFQLATTDRMYQGKSVGFSLGEFVEVWHPEQKVYTLYGHLQEASDDIAYVETTQLAPDIWEPAGVYIDSETFTDRATPVKRGQVIGYVGDSGIGWGYNDSFDTATRHVKERDDRALPSWDETHVHLEVYTRSANGRYKEARFDPFGLYDYIADGRNPYDKSLPATETLWLINSVGEPQYADDV